MIGERISIHFKAQGYSTGSVIRAWDLSLDGQRFLMAKEEERKPQPVIEMILVQNWFEELKRRSGNGSLFGLCFLATASFSDTAHLGCF